MDHVCANHMCDLPYDLVGECGSYIVCVRMCLARWPEHENALPHGVEPYPHTYGLSPVWIRMCTARWLCCENALPHGFGPALQT